MSKKLEQRDDSNASNQTKRAKRADNSTTEASNTETQDKGTDNISRDAGNPEKQEEENKTEEKGLLLADRILVEYLIADTLEAYDGDAERCVLQLASLPVSFTYEIILVEAFFSHILALPVSPQRQVWYTVVLR